MNVGRTVGARNSSPPQWPQQFERPACFRDPRDWAAWVEDARRTASAAELKAMQRGKCPDPCPDCDPASDHRRNAERDGVCIRVVKAPAQPILENS